MLQGQCHNVRWQIKTSGRSQTESCIARSLAAQSISGEERAEHLGGGSDRHRHYHPLLHFLSLPGGYLLLLRLSLVSGALR